MHKRWLLLTALALTASSARAQGLPNDAAAARPPSPSSRAPAAPPTAPTAAPGAVEPAAAQAAPARAAAPAAPAAPDARVPAPVSQVAAVPPPGATYAPPPAGEPAAVQPAAPPAAAPPQAPYDAAAAPPGANGGLRPYEVRLAPPRLYPIPPRPRPPRRYGDAGAPFAIGLGAGFIWRDDVGYELFSRSDHSSAFELFASYDVWAPSPALVISLGAALRSELHEAARTFELAHNALQAEATARFRATGWLWPHLRIAAGFAATRFEAKDVDSDLVFEDRDLGFVGSLGAGLTLRTPARLFETYRGRLASLSLGLMLEGGYTLASAASLRAKPKGSSEIPRDTFAFGELDRGGPYLRVLFVVRF